MRKRARGAPVLSRERFERFIEAMSGRVALKGRVSWVIEEQGGDGSGVGGAGGDDGSGGGGSGGGGGGDPRNASPPKRKNMTDQALWLYLL